MKKIKSKILNKDLPQKNRSVKNNFITNYHKSNTINNDSTSKSSFKVRKNMLSEKNFSNFNTSRNPFSTTIDKNLQLINYYIDQKNANNNVKSNKLYRTEVQTSHRIIRFPTSARNRGHNNNNFINYNNNNKNRYITSYTSSKNYLTFTKNSKNIINDMEKCHTFINLSSLLGKRRTSHKFVNFIYHLDSMKSRKEYSEYILKNAFCKKYSNFKSNAI